MGDGSGGTGAILLNWVHGNHMGVPLIISDASGNPAPAADYAAPGFPGQSRTLADLYYNRYRDYDPTTGRYIQADPIGLAGDVNPYSYAGGNPVTGMDPMGLQYRLPPRLPNNRSARTPEEIRRLPMPSSGGRALPRYLPGEAFIGPPGSRPTPEQIANARKQCIPYGETSWTRYGRQAHNNYRDALGGDYRYDPRLPSGRRPDAVDINNRVVRELKPDNPRAIREGNRQLERYRQELESLYGGNWTSHLDLYRPPSK